MNSIQYCEPCWIQNKWRTPAVVEVDGELLCRRCRDAAGFGEQEGHAIVNEVIPPTFASLRSAERAAPAPEQEKEKQVKAQPEVRTCSVVGCDRRLRKDNTFDTCTPCRKVQAKERGRGQGRPRKDSPARLQQLAQRADGGAKVQPVARRHAVAEIPKPIPTGKATIAVSEAALDRFWQALTLDEKASCFSLQLETFIDSAVEAGR